MCELKASQTATRESAWQPGLSTLSKRQGASRMKISTIILVAALSTLGGQLATAQVSAPTAGVIPGQPSYAAGAPALFKGRAFLPGETVTFKVTHVGGTSATGTNRAAQAMSVPDIDHTPVSVVADPSGAFVATWLVCTTDCVGKLPSLE